MRDVYLRLAKHLQDLIMGYPYNVDGNWCIGCGVCAVSCPAEVISIKRRMESRAPESFADLHHRIKQEKEAAEDVNTRHHN